MTMPTPLPAPIGAKTDGDHAILVEAQKRTADPADYWPITPSYSREQHFPPGGETSGAERINGMPVSPRQHSIGDCAEPECGPQ